ARGIDSSMMMGFPAEDDRSLTHLNVERPFFPLISPIDFLSRFLEKSTKNNEKEHENQGIIAYMTFSYCFFVYSCFSQLLKDEKAGGDFLYGFIFKIILEQFFVNLEHEKLPFELDIPMRA